MAIEGRSHHVGETEVAIALEPLGLPARLWLAFVLPWKVLFDAMFAARVRTLEQAPLSLEPPPKPEEKPPAAQEVEPERDLSPALQLLSILQREGRFVDFLQEDVSGFSDAEIGAAARVVHEGCKRGLSEYVELAPVRTEDEGAPVTLAPGFDPSRTRVTGNVVGEPPFDGKLAHHGWIVSKVSLPELGAGRDPHVIAPAEVEL